MKKSRKHNIGSRRKRKTVGKPRCCSCKCEGTNNPNLSHARLMLRIELAKLVNKIISLSAFFLGDHTLSGTGVWASVKEVVSALIKRFPGNH